MTRLAVFVSGNGSNFQAIVGAVNRRKLKAELSLMVCDNPKARVVQRAAKSRIPAIVVSPGLFDSRIEYEKFIVRILKNQKIDLVVLAGFMRIFTGYFIGAYKNRILNIHPSYLPAYKGAHAIRDAFNARAKETGVTVHVVTAKIDDGPILMQQKIRILKTDNLAALEERIHRAEHRLYPLAIQKFISR